MFGLKNLLTCRSCRSLLLLFWRQFLLAIGRLNLFLHAAEFVIDLGLRLQFLFRIVQILEHVGVSDGLRKGKTDGVVIVLERVLELQCIVVKDFSLLLFLRLWRSFLIGGVSWRIWRSIHRDVWQLLLIRLARRRACGTGLLERPLNPLLLVWISTRRYHIFLTSRHARLYVIAIWQGLPLFEIFELHRRPLGPDKNAHIMLTILIAATPGNPRLRKVHYLKRIRLVLDATSDPKVKPLLMASGVCVHLHKKIIRILREAIPLRLEQISRFKNRIKEQNLISVLLFKLILTLVMAY